jgi:hypothetical protein
MIARSLSGRCRFSALKKKSLDFVLALMLQLPTKLLGCLFFMHTFADFFNHLFAEGG